MQSEVSDEPEATEEDASEPLPPGVRIDDDFLREAKRALKAEELDHPAVRRFLLADVERLTLECRSLKGSLMQLQMAQTELAVAKSEIKRLAGTNRKDTVLFGVASVGAGAAPSYISQSPLGWIFLVLFVAAMLALGFERFKQ